jgi:uncharacterized phage protein (TIGR02218 family)
MATLSQLEKSREESRPVEVYEFTLGSQVFRYTTSEDTLTIGGNDYTPLPILRNGITIGSDQGRRTLQITVPSTNSFVQRYTDVIPGDTAFVTVNRYQRDEAPAFNTTILLFTGKVQSVQFSKDGTSAIIAVRSLESALSRNVPRFTYMGMCNHFLYDAGCGVNPASFDYIGSVSSVSGNTITVAGVSGSGIDFVGGYCRPVAQQDFRLILAQAGDVLTLLLPFSSDPTGANMQCFAGCDHILTGDCQNVFNNVERFGGFAFVPNKNVFQSGLD